MATGVETLPLQASKNKKKSRRSLLTACVSETLSPKLTHNEHLGTSSSFAGNSMNGTVGKHHPIYKASSFSSNCGVTIEFPKTVPVTDMSTVRCGRGVSLFHMPIKAIVSQTIVKETLHKIHFSLPTPHFYSILRQTGNRPPCESLKMPALDIYSPANVCNLESCVIDSLCPQQAFPPATETDGADVTTNNGTSAQSQGIPGVLDDTTSTSENNFIWGESVTHTDKAGDNQGCGKPGICPNISSENSNFIMTTNTDTDAGYTAQQYQDSGRPFVYTGTPENSLFTEELHRKPNFLVSKEEACTTKDKTLISVDNDFTSNNTEDCHEVFLENADLNWVGHNDIHDELDAYSDIREVLDDNEACNDIHVAVGDSDTASEYFSGSDFDDEVSFAENDNVIEFSCPGRTMECPVGTLKCPVEAMERPSEAMEHPNGTMKRPGETIGCPNQTIECPSKTEKRPGDTMSCPTDTGNIPFMKLLSDESGYCENGGPDTKQFDPWSGVCTHFITNEDIGDWDENSSDDGDCDISENALWKSFEDCILSPQNLCIGSVRQPSPSEDNSTSSNCTMIQSTVSDLVTARQTSSILGDKTNDSLDVHSNDLLCLVVEVPSDSTKSCDTLERCLTTAEVPSDGAKACHPLQRHLAAEVPSDSIKMSCTKQQPEVPSDDATRSCDSARQPEIPSDDSTKSCDSALQRRVHFQDKSKICVVHEIIAWSYAYRTARKGKWEEYARNRVHFQRRIGKVASIVEPCLIDKLTRIQSI